MPRHQTRTAIARRATAASSGARRITKPSRPTVGQRYTSGTGGVRASVHYFNDANDIDELLAALKDFLVR